MTQHLECADENQQSEGCEFCHDFRRMPYVLRDSNNCDSDKREASPSASVSHVYGSHWVSEKV